MKQAPRLDCHHLETRHLRRPSLFAFTILIIKYEDVLLNPEETLYSVGKHFKLRVRDKLLYPAEEVKPSQSLKIKTSNENKYSKINCIKNKEYINAFKKQDLRYIENKLDLTLRERFNYDRV